MFKQVLDRNKLDKVIEILTPRREKCLYLYCNVLKYGIGNENFKIFLEEASGDVIGVYFEDSVHILAENGISDSILQFLEGNKPRAIFSSAIIKELQQYDEELTGVYRLQKELFKTRFIHGIKQLGADDMEMLTEFLFEHSEEYRKTYDKEKLEKQLTERLETRYCRYFGKFEDEMLIGCAFTKAETNDIMIVGGILVSPICRGLGIGRELCFQKGVIACQESKTAYCFIDDLNYVSIQLHTGVGYKKVGNIYKYTIRKK